MAQRDGIGIIDIQGEKTTEEKRHYGCGFGKGFSMGYLDMIDAEAEHLTLRRNLVTASIQEIEV